jgi:hypothetical protein
MEYFTPHRFGAGSGHAIAFCFALVGLTGAIQPENFHAGGQCYRDASRWRCIVIPGRVHFGPSGDDIDRSGDEQRGKPET